MADGRPLPNLVNADPRYDYYVRFCGYNDRLDGWYSGDQVYLMPDDLQRHYREQLASIGKEEMRTTENLVIGAYKIPVWYYSPLPEEFCNTDTVYVCEFCMTFLGSEFAYRRHMSRCPIRTPPGDEIYRDDFCCFFEVWGTDRKAYCRNISLIARLFLSHKGLHYDTEVFLFYVMYARVYPDDPTYHFVGYFSKERNYVQRQMDNTLSCIMTLPCFQKHGLGRLMIEFSYLLASKECRIGSPEKPLSDLGFLTFFSYWKRKLSEFLLRHPEPTTSVLEISRATLLSFIDVTESLARMDVLFFRQNGEPVIYFPKSNMEMSEKRIADDLARHVHHIDEKYLHWSPLPTMTFTYRPPIADSTCVRVPQSEACWGTSPKQTGREGAGDG